MELEDQDMLETVWIVWSGSLTTRSLNKELASLLIDTAQNARAWNYEIDIKAGLLVKNRIIDFLAGNDPISTNPAARPLVANHRHDW